MRLEIYGLKAFGFRDVQCVSGFPRGFGRCAARALLLFLFQDEEHSNFTAADTTSQTEQRRKRSTEGGRRLVRASVDYDS